MSALSSAPRHPPGPPHSAALTNPTAAQRSTLDCTAPGCRQTGSSQRTEAVSKPPCQRLGDLNKTGPSRCTVKMMMVVMMVLECCWWVLTATWPGQPRRAAHTTDTLQLRQTIDGDADKLLVISWPEEAKEATERWNWFMKSEGRIRLKVQCSIIF